MSQVAPIMHREPVELDTRHISRALRALVFLKSEGRCALCGVKIMAGAFEADHIIRWADGGPTALDNLQALCSPCHREKTRRSDTPGAAKTKRMANAGNVRSPDEIEPSRLQGRGFDKRLTKGFDGKVKPRKQRRKVAQNLGEPREGGLPPNHNKTSSASR